MVDVEVQAAFRGEPKGLGYVDDAGAVAHNAKARGLAFGEHTFAIPVEGEHAGALDGDRLTQGEAFRAGDAHASIEAR